MALHNVGLVEKSRAATPGRCPGTRLRSTVMGIGKAIRSENRGTQSQSGMQDHLAHRLAARQHLQGVGGLRQRKGAVDMR
jgi:hypothetical protein